MTLLLHFNVFEGRNGPSLTQNELCHCSAAPVIRLALVIRLQSSLDHSKPSQE